MSRLFSRPAKSRCVPARAHLVHRAARATVEQLEWRTLFAAPVVKAVDFAAAEGQAFNGVVAVVVPDDLPATASQFDATIDWGDGTSSPADGHPVLVKGDPNSLNVFQVIGTHTYSGVASANVTVKVVDTSDPIPAGSAYLQSNLVTDSQDALVDHGVGPAANVDANLVNPWGIATRGTSPFRVTDTATGKSTAYNTSGATVGAAATIPGTQPTGVVGNPTADFEVAVGDPSAFIFSTLTGNLAVWSATTDTTAVIKVSRPGHAYTGLTLGANSGGNRLYAADFANGAIDVYTGAFASTTLTGSFIDATIPAGYHPYNIQDLGGSMYVMYAQLGNDGKPVAGDGNGFVRKFNTDGVRDLTFGINNGALNVPWGATIAPATFGIFGGALLIGNEGSGNVAAYNPATGAPLGTLENQFGDPHGMVGMRALTFGNGSNGGDLNTLYFTAGLDGGVHGLLGALTPSTELASGADQATATIDVADAPALSIDDVTKDEGDSGKTSFTFTVTRTGDASGTSSVDYFTTFGGPTTSVQDLAVQSGTVTFASGQTSRTITILVNGDTKQEEDNLFLVNLTNAQGATIDDGDGKGTILNDDGISAPTTTLKINDVKKNEGDNGKTAFNFTVTRSGSLSGSSSVKYATSFGNSSTSVQDLLQQSGTITFAAGQATKTITIFVNGDTKDEVENVFYVNLSNATGATIIDTRGKGRIVNDD
jgi:uncharacterized protein (TIGR03118 family)